MINFQTALVQLPLVRESTGKYIRTPQDAHSVCKDLEECAQESFHAIVLNTKNQMINRVLVTLGLVDASLVHPREVFRAAIQNGASAIVLVHNHPTGDPTPSSEDLRITRQLIEAGRIVDIKVVDHIVIGRAINGRPAFISMCDSGLCAFG